MIDAADERRTPPGDGRGVLRRLRGSSRIPRLSRPMLTRVGEPSSVINNRPTMRSTFGFSKDGQRSPFTEFTKFLLTPWRIT